MGKVKLTFLGPVSSDLQEIVFDLENRKVGIAPAKCLHPQGFRSSLGSNLFAASHPGFKVRSTKIAPPTSRKGS